MKRIVIGVIVLTGLLVGQLGAHPCNAAAIERKDSEKEPYPALVFDSGPISPPEITDQAYVTSGGGSIKTSETQWTDWSYYEGLDTTPQGWGQCEAGIIWLDTAEISIGGGFNLCFPLHRIAGFSVTLPQFFTKDVSGPAKLPESNHRFRFVEYKKQGTVTYTGTEYTFSPTSGYLIDHWTVYDLDTQTVGADYYIERECCELSGG